MARTPPPPAIREEGDRLVVVLRPDRSWDEVVLLILVAIGWTVGVVALAAGVLHGGNEDGAGVAVAGLLFFGAIDVALIANVVYLIVGRTTLVASPHEIVARTEVGRFSRTRRSPGSLVDDVRAAETDGEDGPTGQFTVRVTSGRRQFDVGDLSADGAAELAGLVWAYIHPARREADGYGWSRPVAAQPRRAPSRPAKERPVPLILVVPLAGAALLALLAWPVVHAGDERIHPPPTLPEAGLASGTADEYAAAMTFFALQRRGLVATEGPRCSGTDARWSCTVVARRDAGGPSAPHTFVCTSGDRQAVDAVNCGRLAGT